MPRQSDSRTGKVVFLLVVAATLLAELISFSARLTPIDIVVLVAASALYALFGTEGFARIEHAGSMSMRLMYFTGQVGLAVLAMIVSGVPELVGLLLFPLAAQAAITLPRGWLLVVCAVILATVAVLIECIVRPSLPGTVSGCARRTEAGDNSSCQDGVRMPV